MTPLFDEARVWSISIFINPSFKLCQYFRDQYLTAICAEVCEMLASFDGSLIIHNLVSRFSFVEASAYEMLKEDNGPSGIDVLLQAYT